ncbi:hypothetical protein CNMCM6936_008754 [Aspergillus lentulus]|uniref:Uncharacterized protein n=1 Tax=Aspergillus lentulus TaxID=293939 RepID=A0AAN5YKA8_ASPLE|nr:hypothetical protein CNMCM6069_009409 [Aspergillus lentulus]KAF4164787.1 hypothetical protein CNMCM6936_008754 [Aspergillus lentulus]KAF4172258.1 hypothetical protein CNMCM8060_001725 [Aspergillus lentulus]KAF4181236.1 hypothetical protein CNMCM7927_000731 [Aspergillus lentulus]KAF4193454.1 hypothetical protein CNMCM8694_008890 [Aspergillus lentulus]
MARQELTANLPDDHIVVQFTTLEDLQQTAERVHSSLNQTGNEHQFILILGLTENSRIELDSEERPLNGIPYRFMWENTAGILKILTNGHDVVRLNITRAIDLFCSRMGMDPTAEFAWMSLPQGRMRRDREAWPTLVIEAGVTASLPRLREEARWWLRNSQGDIRIVLVLGIHRQRRMLTVEKWEQERPLIQQHQHQPSHQPEASLPGYAAQTIEISPESVSGAPLVLSFEELLERPRQGREADIILAEEQLRGCMCWVWQFMD